MVLVSLAYVLDGFRGKTMMILCILPLFIDPRLE